MSHKIKLDNDTIEDYAYLQYTDRADRPKIFLLFFLLYPHLDFAHHFHIDHIFPRYGFSKTNLNANLIFIGKLRFFVLSFMGAKLSYHYYRENPIFAEILNQ